MRTNNRLIGGNKTLFYIFAVTFLISVLFISFASAGIGDWFRQITGRATTQQVTINITLGNTAPNITFVVPTSAVTATENTFTPFLINFTAYDADGSGNLKTSAIANITKGGEATRSNSSCIQIVTYGTYYANYSCTINLWYFDTYGTWNIGLSINDSSDSIGYNTTATVTVNQLTAFTRSPGALTFNSLNPGSVNTTSNNDPVVMNNTGNDPIATDSIDLNATNLLGEVDSGKGLYAANFTAGLVTNATTKIECGVTTNQTTILSPSVYTVIPNATLPNGNHSINDGTAQEQLYYCLRLAGSELSSQSYSTSNQGAWTLRVV